MTESMEITKDDQLTEEQKQMLRAAKKMPIVYDEDSPEFTEEMLDRLMNDHTEQQRETV